MLIIIECLESCQKYCFIVKIAPQARPKIDYFPAQDRFFIVLPHLVIDRFETRGEVKAIEIPLMAARQNLSTRAHNWKLRISPILLNPL